MKITTRYAPPPIPARLFDWAAIDDDTYEGGCPVGYGATEQEAIDDLLSQLQEVEVNWKPEVKVSGDEKFYANALVFATKEEAESNARDLMMRWLAVTEYRAVETSDPVNYRWVNHQLEEVPK